MNQTSLLIVYNALKFDLMLHLEQHLKQELVVLYKLQLTVRY